MKREAQGVVLALLGAAVARVVISGDAARYVRPGMRPLLLVSAVLLLVLGGALLAAAVRRPAAGAHAVPRVAWLLAVPMLLALVAPPPALGAFAARRASRPGSRAPAPPTPREREIRFVPLPPAREGAVDVSLLEFTHRALLDAERSADGVPLRLVGFVVPSAPQAFQLTRFQINCCAADAIPVQVLVHWGGRIPAADKWVEVVGVRRASEDALELEASSLRVVPEPAEPYERLK